MWQREKGAEFSEVQFAIGRHFYFLKFALPSKTLRGMRKLERLGFFILCYRKSVLRNRKEEGFLQILVFHLKNEAHYKATFN